MINVCPFCGKFLDKPLVDGISSCQHCQRVFDSSDYYKLLTASWYCRKNHIDDISIVMEQFDLSPEYGEIIDSLIIKGCFSHDQFYKVVEERYHKPYEYKNPTNQSVGRAVPGQIENSRIAV